MVDNEQLILEEYKVWKKNVKFLYDFVLTHSFYWPSLTVQFFPEATRNENKNTTTQKLLLSTHTSGNDREYLQIASVNYIDQIIESVQSEPVGDSRIKIVQKIEVTHEVNRARYSSFMSNIIGARSDSKYTHIYDYTKHKNESDRGPDMILTGHNKGGYGISWAYKKMEVATAGEDGLVCLYDIKGNERSIGPKAVFEGHTSVVNDCSFSRNDVIASVGDDKKLIFWDGRSKNKINEINMAHASDIHSVTFNPNDPNILATGSADASIKIWELRNMKSFATLLSHKKEILQMEWNPRFKSILASCSADRRVCIWDISKINKVSNDEYPAELIFIHGGHTNRVCDISWNPLESFEIASVAEDNVIQIWQMTKKNQ